MAWRFVTHTCGHQERINVDGPYVVVEQRVKNAERVSCPPASASRPDSDTIRIVRTRYELVEDNTVLDTADMGEEQALDELARLLASPMPRTDRLMRLKDKFEKTAEWCRDTLGDEQEAKDVEDMAEHYMHVCEACNNKYSGRHDPVSVFEGWLLGEELGTPYETRRQAASRMLSNVHRLDKE